MGRGVSMTVTIVQVWGGRATGVSTGEWCWHTALYCSLPLLMFFTSYSLSILSFSFPLPLPLSLSPSLLFSLSSSLSSKFKSSCVTHVSRTFSPPSFSPLSLGLCHKTKMNDLHFLPVRQLPVVALMRLHFNRLCFFVSCRDEIETKQPGPYLYTQIYTHDA